MRLRTDHADESLCTDALEPGRGSERCDELWKRLRPASCPKDGERESPALSAPPLWSRSILVKAVSPCGGTRDAAPTSLSSLPPRKAPRGRAGGGWGVDRSVKPASAAAAAAAAAACDAVMPLAPPPPPPPVPALYGGIIRFRSPCRESLFWRAEHGPKPSGHGRVRLSTSSACPPARAGVPVMLEPAGCALLDSTSVQMASLRARTHARTQGAPWPHAEREKGGGGR